jgi:poly(A) polymerase
MDTPDLSQHRVLRDPKVRTLLQILNRDSNEAARLVGGCVRDAVLNRSVGDIDIATQHLPQSVISRCEAAGHDAYPTGIGHGTVTIVIEGTPFEVTTLRQDVETDGRHAIVAFTDDWTLDASRRDFTMNALYCGADGKVFDPTGQGVRDAKAGRLVFVGEPTARIEEDALRILRFFRFAAYYGKGPLDEAGLSACAALQDRLHDLSVERIWMELKKLLKAPDPSAVLKTMAATGILAKLLPEAQGFNTFDRLLDIETTQFFEPDPSLRLMALLPRRADVVEALSARLKLSNGEASRLQAWAKDTTELVSYASAREVRAALYYLGPELYLDRVRLAWAGDGEPRRNSQWRAMIAMQSGFVAPRFPLSGNHVLAAGARPGPAVGQILREVERWWVENDFIDDELSLFERLKAVTQALG